MEIIGLEKDEKILVRAEKSVGRVLWVIIYSVLILILWFALLRPLLFQMLVSQYSVRYESLNDLIVSAITQKAADYFYGIFFLVWDGIFLLDRIITVIFIAIRHVRRELYLTDQRIFGHTGNLFLGKRGFNIPFSAITKISIREGIITKLFGYGFVDIDTQLGRYSVEGIGNIYDFLQYDKRIQTDCEISKEKQQREYEPAGGDHEELKKEYQAMIKESGVFYHELTGDPVLEKRERYYIDAAAALYMLLGVFWLVSYNAIFPSSEDAVWSWVPKLIEGVLIFGGISNLFIGFMVIKLKAWAFRIMQIILILGIVVNGLRFIGALPELASLGFLGMVAYDVVAFCLVNAGLSALSEMVQSARR